MDVRATSDVKILDCVLAAGMIVQSAGMLLLIHWLARPIEDSKPMPIDDSKGRIALRPSHPSARRVYPPAALP